MDVVYPRCCGLDVHKRNVNLEEDRSVVVQAVFERPAKQASVPSDQI